MRAEPSIVTSNNTGDFRSRKANIDPFDTWTGFQTGENINLLFIHQHKYLLLQEKLFG
jgi:hypothetical protein